MGICLFLFMCVDGWTEDKGKEGGRCGGVFVLCWTLARYGKPMFALHRLCILRLLLIVESSRSDLRIATVHILSERASARDFPIRMDKKPKTK